MRYSTSVDRPYGPTRRALELTSPFQDGTVERRKATQVEAIQLVEQPHLGLVIRYKRGWVRGHEVVTRHWEFFIRIECQHWAYPGETDCRYGCEERKVRALQAEL